MSLSLDLVLPGLVIIFFNSINLILNQIKSFIAFKQISLQVKILSPKKDHSDPNYDLLYTNSSYFQTLFLKYKSTYTLKFLIFVYKFLQYKMPITKAHLNLITFCFATFANAIGFGFFYGNSSTFANYYNVSEDSINNTFYIGLVTQIVFCIPALKVIQWRLDYSVIAGSFLTFSSYWIQVIAEDSFLIIVAASCLLGLGQSLLLPLGPYFAQKWFQLEQRSFVIALSFYSNIFGLAFGGILTAVYIGNDQTKISSQIFIIAIISTGIFLLTIVIIRNPKKKIQKYKKFSIEQIKLLWRQKFNTYSVIMASVFLGISWNFLSTSSQFLDIFTPMQVGILLSVWISSGTIFGVVVAYVIDKISAKKGSSWWNDLTFKMVLSLTLVGYLVLGILSTYNINNYWIYVITMVVLGVGNLGNFGLIFLSFIQTLYPINSLIIGTIIAVGASFYSTLIQSLSNVYFLNDFYFMAIGLVLPWIFITVVYKTNFKRYKYYLNQKKAKYQLLKVQEVSQYKSE